MEKQPCCTWLSAMVNERKIMYVKDSNTWYLLFSQGKGKATGTPIRFCASCGFELAHLSGPPVPPVPL